MYKVFFDNKTLIFCDPRTTVRSTSPSHKVLLRKDGSETSIQEAVKALSDPEMENVIIETPDVETAFKKFKSLFTVIKAGGGFVYTASSKLLMIFRRKKWDLPKGKLDEGENLEQCSLREVAEETGVTSLVLEKRLLTTYHTYIEKGKPILKESHWFLMRAQEEADLIPQSEEDIERCEWVPFEAIAAYHSDTHLSIKEVINAGLKAVMT
jgi:ADP-ribose pyrophosphatase YjhB (NUDIX family)